MYNMAITNSEILECLGRNVHYQRKALGMTQEKLAEAVNSSTRCV